MLAMAVAACAAIKCYDGAVSSVSNSLATKKDCAAGIDVCKYWGTGIALNSTHRYHPVESRSLTRPVRAHLDYMTKPCDVRHLQTIGNAAGRGRGCR